MDTNVFVIDFLKGWCDLWKKILTPFCVEICRNNECYDLFYIFCIIDFAGTLPYRIHLHYGVDKSGIDKNQTVFFFFLHEV